MNSKKFVRQAAAGVGIGAALACGWLSQRPANADHGGPGIILDATSSTSANDAAPGLTFSHTVGAGNNRYLVVTFGFKQNGNLISTITYNGAGLGKLQDQGNAGDCTAGVYGLSSPTTGTNNVVVTFQDTGTATAMAAGATSFLNTSASAGITIAAFGDASSPTVTFASASTIGNYIVDAMCLDAADAMGDTTIDGNNGSDPTSQVERWDAVNASTIVHGGSSTEPGASTASTLSWTLGGSRNWAQAAVTLNKSEPTLVGFDALDAARDGGRVHIGWRTGFEVDNLGFILYREVNGARARITPGLIAGSALTAGQGVSLRAGRSYGWVDQPSVQNSSLRYWLEEIDLTGKRTMRGPITPARSIASAAFPDLVRLGVVTKPSAALGSSEVRLFADERQPVAHIQRAPDGQPASRVKFHINQEGFFRVTQAQLAAAGFDTGAGASQLRLIREGKEIPFIVNSAGGVEFFATGADFSWTNEAVYWLDAASAGKRIPVQPALTPDGDEASSFRASAESRERSNYFGALLNGDKDNFFGAMVAKTEVEVPINVEGLDPTQPGGIDIFLQGVSDVGHVVQVKVNGSTAAQLGFGGRKPGHMASALAAGVLTEGINKVTLIGLGGDADVTMVDSISLGYARKYQAVSGRLRFTATGGKRVTLTGFETGTVRVFDITDPASVEEITADVSGMGAGRAIRVVPPGTGERTLLAITDDQIPAPPSIRGDSPSFLSAAAPGADLIIISHRDFKASLAPLRALRESEGLTVAGVDVEDLYDEFSYGQTSPYAIRAFITHARTKWQHPPRFVLLVGDASFDPKNNLGKGSWDFVPTKFVDVGTLAASVDDWFVTPEGKAFADISIGRLPVRTPQEATAVVSKIVAFRQGQGRDREIFLYADQPSGEDFEAEAKGLATDLAARLKVTALFRSQAALDTKPQLLTALNMGPLIAGYLGHGSEDQWAGHTLTTADVVNLTNRGRPSLYLPMTCLNNYFTNVYQIGLGKALLLASDGGAMAVWGSSAVADASRQLNLNRAFLSHLTGGSSRTLGEAILKAKVEARNPEIDQSWILLGDPSTQMPFVAAPGGDAGTGGSGGSDGGTTGADGSGVLTGADGAPAGNVGGGTGCSCAVGNGGGGSEGFNGLAVGLLLAGLVGTGVRLRRRTAAR